MDALVLRGSVLLAILVLVSALAMLQRRRGGQARTVAGDTVLTATELGAAGAAEAQLGQRATFVQFSSPACAPCRNVRRVLGQVVAGEPGLAHLEIDASERLELARRLGILRTPTVLLLDPRGRVLSRISGVPTPEQARAAVRQSIASSTGAEDE
jgi:thioredoxin-like negative regulator of GroEL